VEFDAHAILERSTIVNLDIDALLTLIRALTEGKPLLKQAAIWTRINPQYCASHISM